MSNEYCVGIIGIRDGRVIENPISYGNFSYEFLVQTEVNPKRFLLDVKITPEFTLKPIDNNVRLALFFNPSLSQKRSRNVSKDRIVEQFFGVPDRESNVELFVSSGSASDNLTPSTSEVYSMLHEAHKRECKTNRAVKLPKFFLPTLRPYQANALEWMLGRERVTSYQVQEFVPIKCHWIANKIFYFNDRTNELLDYEPHLTMPTGGILADEMGLGKTVEILALILANPNFKRKLSDDQPVIISRSVQTTELRCLCRNTISNGLLVQCPKCSYWQHENCVAKYSAQPILNYICPKCWQLEPPVRSATTFIACPLSIKNQWSKEIRKHISSPHFKIFDYNGIKGSQWISPIDLAEYDVVLCDYDAVRSEIHYTNRNSAYNTRQNHKYIIAESPLTKVFWWRVVLDEAQMVETPINPCSRMVKQLPAIHRWAVTGTPIVKSIDDLYGLMIFLDNEPYTNRNMWNKLTTSFNNGNARPLIEQCLKKIMWRTSKMNVLMEMNIPPQQEIVHNLKMDELEAKFYSHKHSKCESEFNRTVEKLTRTSNELKMNSRILKLIMDPLRKLRRDCTVPTITITSIGGWPVERIIKSYNELYVHMVDENERGCNEALAAIATYSNDLADWHLESGNINDAIEMYENVLTLVKDCTDLVRIKSMPPLRSLRNLLKIIHLKELNENLCETKVECIKEIERLEWAHLQRTNDSLEAIRTKQINLENEINFRTKSADEKTFRWWNDFFDVANKEEENLLVEEINGILKSNADKVTSFDDIKEIVHSWLDTIETERGNLKNLFKEHDFFTTNMKPPIHMSEEALNQFDQHYGDDVVDFGNDFKSIHTHDCLCLPCHTCKLTHHLKKYGCLIFDNRGQRHSQEKVLRAIADTLDVSVHHNTIENATKHFEVISLLQMEFKEYRSYLLKVKDGIKLQRKLKMGHAQRDIPLRTDQGPVQATNILNKNQNAKEKFNKIYHILKYVKRLEKSKQLDVECPICLEVPISTEFVLQCGHKMCSYCFATIKENHPITYTCHACRNIQATDNTYQVFKDLETDVDQTPVTEITGDYSKKIREIVRTALDLRKADPDVKIIIFSHWNDILILIAAALSNNGILNRTKSSPFDKCVDEFKNKDLKVTCLLLPLACGSKGLNLIEATHLFLVEPIIDPAEESQAIGRIHRIGQTKPTFIHRFIMLNTIEETIFTTISKDMAGKWKTTNITVDNLKRLFKQYRRID